MSLLCPSPETCGFIGLPAGRPHFIAASPRLATPVSCWPCRQLLGSLLLASTCLGEAFCQVLKPKQWRNVGAPARYLKAGIGS